jgi:putative Mg2+ transporter-C (MgtC) family protein
VPPASLPELPEAILRLAVAFVLSAVIGIERERPDRPAGLRTHVLVCIGACLLMMLSVGVAGEARVGADPGRIAAQVVTGMGFLGAGTIIRHGSIVRGLTTAASLWTTSAVGLAVGLGWYVLAVVATLGVFLTLSVVRAFERRLAPRRGYARLAVGFAADEADVGAVVARLRKLGAELRRVELEPTTGEAERMATVLIRLPSGLEPEAVARELGQLDAVLRAEVI